MYTTYQYGDLTKVKNTSTGPLTNVYTTYQNGPLIKVKNTSIHKGVYAAHSVGTQWKKYIQKYLYNPDKTVSDKILKS